MVVKIEKLLENVMEHMVGYYWDVTDFFRGSVRSC